PIPKPSYLFALVAGQLGLIEDTFTTASGRTVALKIYSEHDNLDQLDHAMTSLKHSMAWDEQRYGLEYDLDVYHIVATHDFNMGAMENKSLNIFNARFVLADPDTATDADYEGIESVIAHEYFHNWTGNRVTCRDWFQLTLKEGLTVFRDQEFSADMQSKAVTRIQHVNTLLNRQFLEDAGPMAHSIRPQRYVEINNFYTATVYEKGAEIIRMYQTLLGREGFRRGMDLYFERHDGQAVTCDDFLAAMADANRVDLDQFGRWYSQVGTPRLAVRAEWSEIEKSLTLEFEQSLMAHPDNASIGPLHIPIRIGFLTREGAAMAVPLADHSQAASEHLIELKSVIEVVRFTGFSERPVVSLLRDFSAPVLLDYDWSEAELALLLAHDRDPVARWLAGKRLAATVLEQAVVDVQQARAVSAPTALIDALDAVLLQAEDDPALAAELLQLPSETEVAQRIQPVDVGAIHRARKQIVQHLVAGLQPALLRCYERCVDQSPWAFKAEDVGRRRLANRCLTWLVMSGLEVGQTLALEQIQSADNLTNRLAALQALVHQNSRYADEQLHAFEQRYSDNALVMDKWFSVQATQPDPSVVERLHELIQHPSFSLKNPNKARALIGSFGQNNPIAFHRNDAAGYALVADMVCALDRMNPQVAAR
ncbi:MAG: aminopeptidase N, partial [Pseudomonadota bacterium]